MSGVNIRKLNQKKPKLIGPVSLTNSTTIYLDANDSNISPLISRGEFEKLETNIIKRLVREGMNVCDIGAHIGYYSLLVSTLVGGTGRVYAFEPDPINYYILKENKILNKFNNLVLSKAAISSKTGKTNLFLCRDNSGDHRIFDAEKKRPSIEINVTTLDNYFKNFKKKLDLIKMDIQGAEMEALKGMVNCIKKNEEIILITEFWPYGLIQAGSEPKEFIDLLDRLGFKIFNINEEKFKIEAFLADKFLRQNKERQFTNLLCIRRNSFLPQTLIEIGRKKNKKITSFRQLKESYEGIWTTGDLREEQTYYKWIISLLGDVKSKKLLDIGCGGGYLLEEAIKNGIRATGLEISESAIKKARNRAPKAKIIQGIAEKLPFKDKDFDIVVCLGSLEHFLSPRRALKEIARVLKDDGICCIVLPNRFAIDGILEGVVRGNDLSHGQELERFYSLKEAINLLSKGGFVIKRMLSYNKPHPTDIRTGTKLSFIVDFVYKNIYKFIRWHISIRLSYVFVFILKKDDIADKTIH